MTFCARLWGIAALSVIAAGPAFGETAPASPSPAATATPETLSKKLGQSDGVIHPSEVDPKMDKPAPSVGDGDVVRTPAPEAPKPK